MANVLPVSCANSAKGKDMERGKAVKGIAVFGIMGAGVFLFFGGWGWLFGNKANRANPVAEEVKDPFVSIEPISYNCCDGTTYLVGDSGVFWLVKGKAVNVKLDEDMPRFNHITSDPHGGAYLMSKKHLWYLKDGNATRVTEVPLSDVKPEDHAMTRATVLWSALRGYGHVQYDEGYTAGYDEGYDAGSLEKSTE